MRPESRWWPSAAPRAGLCVLAALALATPCAHSAETPSDPAVAQAAATARAAPATVLEHHVEVRVDGGRRLTESTTWVLRVEDPAACAAGLITPPGLDGATDAGAAVLEDLLILPGDVQAGDTFTLQATRTAGRGAHSGLFLTAPDLPLEWATFSVTAPLWVPLHVWSDAAGAPTYGSRRIRSARVEWVDLDGREPAQVVWSTWKDWLEAGEPLQEATTGKLAETKAELGRALAANVDTLSVPQITERVYRDVELLGGPPGTWTDARPTSEILQARSGTAAERGIVLLSMLRLAGYEAQPGQFRLAARGSFPITVPAPAMLDRPVVITEDRRGRTVYVDPASPYTRVPERPASMYGASVWTPGDLPLRLLDDDIVDGTAIVNTNVTLRPNGAANWSSTITADGAAAEYFRQLLGPVDEVGRIEALERLARQSRPDLERFTAAVTGAEKPSKDLKISAQGHDLQAIDAFGYGLAGTVPAVFAPALAGWLPPKVRVLESVSVSSPQTVKILATANAPPKFGTEAVVARDYGRQAGRLVLQVDVQRPYRGTTPARDTAAKRFLAAEAPEGAELVLSAGASGSVLKALRTDEARSDADRAILEALLWWSESLPRKATKTLQKARATVPFEDLAAGLAKWAEPDDPQPWDALAKVDEDDPSAQIQVAEHLAQSGLVRESWVLAHELHQASDPDVRVRALLLKERLQGPEPDPEVDPEGAEMWEDPTALIEEAEGAAAAMSEGPDERLVYRRAELLLEEERTAEAEALLEELVAGGGTARAAILQAHAAALSGVAQDEVRRRIDAAVEQAPYDADVLATAAGATRRVGDPLAARDFALTAARLAFDDPRLWSDVVDHALAVGDLPIATFAARRASDLDPTSTARGAQLATLAYLTQDEEATELGRQRSHKSKPMREEWPPSMDDRMKAAPAEALYGLLQLADAEVVANPGLLAMRAQMRIDGGALDDASRDGFLLAARHGMAEGTALAFAANAGRLFSSTARQLLDEAARYDLTSQVTRMEYRLVSAAGDPQKDARALSDDPRAAALLEAVRDPAAATARIEGWPEGLEEPTLAPLPGFRANAALGGAVGVAAISNPEEATALIRVSAVTGLLPPPLSDMYELAPQPLRSLHHGGQVLRLLGGVMPLYVATALDGGHELYGLGFTEQAAVRVLDQGLQGPQ